MPESDANKVGYLPQSKVEPSDCDGDEIVVRLFVSGIYENSTGGFDHEFNVKVHPNESLNILAWRLGQVAGCLK